MQSDWPPNFDPPASASECCDYRWAGVHHHTGHDTIGNIACISKNLTGMPYLKIMYIESDMTRQFF
jgi:hypothetical protein